MKAVLFSPPPLFVVLLTLSVWPFCFVLFFVFLASLPSPSQQRNIISRENETKKKKEHAGPVYTCCFDSFFFFSLPHPHLCFHYFFSTYVFFYARPSFSCVCSFFFFELSIERFITFLLSYLCILAIQLLLVVIALRSQEFPQQRQQLCKRKAACKRISHHPFSLHPHPFSSQWFLSAFLSKSSVIGTHQNPFFFFLSNFFTSKKQNTCQPCCCRSFFFFFFSSLSVATPFVKVNLPLLLLSLLLHLLPPHKLIDRKLGDSLCVCVCVCVCVVEFFLL